MAIDRSIGNYHDSSNARIRKIGRITGPAAYVVGGDPVTPADIGLGKIEAFLFEDAIDAGLTANYELAYDHTNQAVVWFSIATGVEVVVGTDLSAFAARFEAIGY
jgi:hypothetical protein